MIVLRPSETLQIAFDASTEDLFDSAIARCFPEVARRLNDERGERKETRSTDSFGIEYWQPDLDFEMNWLLSTREIALVTQVNVPLGAVGATWSLADGPDPILAAILRILTQGCSTLLLRPSLPFFDSHT